MVDPEIPFRQEPGGLERGDEPGVFRADDSLVDEGVEVEARRIDAPAFQLGSDARRIASPPVEAQLVRPSPASLRGEGLGIEGSRGEEEHARRGGPGDESLGKPALDLDAQG